MKGLYLYCIREKTEERERLGRGVDKKEKVYIVPCGNIEAVVSDIPFDDFISQDLYKKAAEDLRWIKEKAELHESVIEKAMGKKKRISVIPMKFGTIFKSVEKLNSTLQKNYSKFSNILKRLKGKQEWSVKVYLKNQQALEEDIRNQSPELKTIQNSLTHLPEGLAYFKEKELEDTIETRFKEIVANYRELFFSHLEENAVLSNRGKILEEELTGNPHPMILNAIFLIPDHGLERFKTRIDQLAREAGSKGFHFEYSGPWPPYNFV